MKNYFFFVAFLLPLFSTSPYLSASLHHVYFGTHGKGSDGIYHAIFNSQKGRLSKPRLVVETPFPSFLAEHPTLNILYAIVGSDEHVHAFKRNTNGSLSFLNKSAIGDGRSAHLAVHPSGKFLITAQYRNGSVGVFPLNAKGEVLERIQLLKHEGASKVIPKRQDRPHPHWTGFSPDGRFALIPDLGMDQIVIYRVEPEKSFLREHGRAIAPPGSAPRHMRFSVDGRFIYLLNELSLTISTFSYHAESGTTKLIETNPTLSEEAKANQSSNAASEILVHPNGKYLYSANRGHDSVTVYERDSSSGQLTPLEVEATRGSWPRSMTLDPTAKWLVVGNQFSNGISIFSIGENSGELTFAGRETLSVPNPSCILFPKNIPK